MVRLFSVLMALAILGAPMAQSYAVAGDRGKGGGGSADKSRDKGGGGAADKSKDKGGGGGSADKSKDSKDNSKDKGKDNSKDKGKDDCKSRDGTPRECGVERSRIDPLGGLIRGLFK
jgi:hypothetical protein